MQIKLENLSKKYRNEWIFRQLTHSFTDCSSTAITGSNGSGKSTLLQVISGILPASSGSITYTKNNQNIEPDTLYKDIALCTPILELVEEFTLVEQIKFHFNLKPASKYEGISAFLAYLNLEKSKDKQLKYFSSGMKQKLKLALSFMSDASILLLDEPTTNLDEANKIWYQAQIESIKGGKTIIIASNEPAEYKFVDQVIDILKYKN